MCLYPPPHAVGTRIVSFLRFFYFFIYLLLPLFDPGGRGGGAVKFNTIEVLYICMCYDVLSRGRYQYHGKDRMYPGDVPLDGTDSHLMVFA